VPRYSSSSGNAWGLSLRVPAAAHDGFGSRQTAEQIGNLAALGVTRVYLSPILKANPGTRHRYDLLAIPASRRDLGGEWARPAPVSGSPMAPS